MRSASQTSTGFVLPNALFVRFLNELCEEARRTGQVVLVQSYSKALASMIRYPLPLQSGQDALKLENIGQFIASKLDAKLKDYLRDHPDDDNAANFFQARGAPAPSTSQSSSQNTNTNGAKKVTKKRKALQDDQAMTLDTGAEGSDAQTAKKKVTRKTRTPPEPKEKVPKRYVPKERSGGWAILVAMYYASIQPQYVGYMDKKTIMQLSQCNCRTSFTSAPGEVYTAWSSMSLLTEKKLVEFRSNPKKFSLSAEGSALARELYDANVNDLTFEKSVVPFDATMPLDTTPAKLYDFDLQSFLPVGSKQRSNNAVIHMEADSQEPVYNVKNIKLLIDNREKKSQDRNYINATLTEMGISCEVRQLELGDFLWVGYCNVTNAEIVLDYIIERKTLSDLESSIRDDRYKEQKFRLSQSGLKKLIYLIEGDFNVAQSDLNLKGSDLNVLKSAIVSTQLDEFLVHRTKTVLDTCKFLSRLTQQIVKKYRLLPLKKSEYKSFHYFCDTNNKNKNLLISDIAAMQLICLPGISGVNSHAIVTQYPTILSLYRAFANLQLLSQEKSQSMLANIQTSDKRKVGKKISQTVCDFYTRTS